MMSKQSEWGVPKEFRNLGLRQFDGIDGDTIIELVYRINPLNPAEVVVLDEISVNTTTEWVGE